MPTSVAIIAPGAMGAAVGGQLVAHGILVRTSLEGRGEGSAARAAAFGLLPGSDAEAVASDVLLSIVPPAQALPLAERLSPLLRRADRKPLYVDCNAVSPATASHIAEVVGAAGCAFVDAGIIGLPPEPDRKGPVFYASGEPASRFAALAGQGIDVRVLDAPVGAASALKLSYAGITKGLLALGTSMALAATRAGVAEALYAELGQSQPALLGWLERSMPGMFPKAYRWVAEMEAISEHAAASEGARQIYAGAARLFADLAEDVASTRTQTAALLAFLAHKG